MNDKEFSNFLSSLINPEDDLAQDGDGLSLKELFEKRISELGLSQNQAEKLLNIERKSLVGILDRSAKRVDVVNILKLGKFLNLKVDDVLKIYVNEMPPDAIGDLEKAQKSNFIVSHFDLNNLRKAKVIDTKTDFEAIENRLTKFFGLGSIYDYEKSSVFPVFSRTKRNSNSLMREFWVKSAYAHFQSINNPNPYDRTALVELIPKIRPYTMNIDKGLFIVAQALYNIGVTVIYQPKLPTVQVRGATFLVNDKPCIVITDLNDNYPTMWFALLHELHHTLYDLETIKTNVYHITGEPDLLLMNEEKANEFAREYLFSNDKSKYIEAFIFDEILVEQYAKKSQVHPSFIYSFYNYDRQLAGDRFAWSRYKEFFPDVKRSIRNLNTNPWEKETIQESVELIKETVFNLI